MVLNCIVETTNSNFRRHVQAVLQWWSHILRGKIASNEPRRQPFII